MPLPDEGPCQPWCEWADVKECIKAADQTKFDLISAPVQTMLIDVASEILYNLSGSRYPGLCDATRSVCRPCSCGCSWSWSSQLGPGCCCRDRRRLDLDLGGYWPVAEVVEVVVAGVPFLDYRVDDWRWLVRLDDEDWPRCNDLEDPSAFSVTWRYGRAIPKAGKRAAAIFVAEFAKKCAGLTCEIPERVTQITQGTTTYTIMDSLKMIDDGRTGMYVVDLWLKSLELARIPGSSMLDPAAAGRFAALGTDSDAS